MLTSIETESKEVQFICCHHDILCSFPQGDFNTGLQFKISLVKNWPDCLNCRKCMQRRPEYCQSLTIIQDCAIRSFHNNSSDDNIAVNIIFFCHHLIGNVDSLGNRHLINTNEWNNASPGTFVHTIWLRLGTAFRIMYANNFRLVHLKTILNCFDSRWITTDRCDELRFYNWIASLCASLFLILFIVGLFNQQRIYNILINTWKLASL